MKLLTLLAADATVVMHPSQLIADEITLQTGEAVSYIKTSKIEPDGLQLLYADGVRKIPVEMLTDADMQRANLNPKDAEKARAKQGQEMRRVEDERKN